MRIGETVYGVWKGETLVYTKEISQREHQRWNPRAVEGGAMRGRERSKRRELNESRKRIV